MESETLDLNATVQAALQGKGLYGNMRSMKGSMSI